MPPYIAPEEGDRVGVWGSPTSTLDWCEENHVLSYYIAEFCEKIDYAITWYSLFLKPANFGKSSLSRVEIPS